MVFTRIILFIALFIPVFSSAQTGNRIKEVKGMWLNFSYMDERNKYMNPKDADITSPQLWREKVKELSEMGIEYLVIMYAANERKSYYPSSFMQPAYPKERESPVEAVLNAADENNMKVFMSTGWAANQDDDITKPDILNTQIRILQETAGLYSKHTSFYGWYFPCEGVIAPYLSQRHVDVTNKLSEEARKLTPDAKIMISPYGLRMVRFNDNAFAQQISKLKVDIIAYQDEIGCVTEPMPMPRMKDNFAKLRELHNANNIAFWSNDEIFTWEKGLNVRNSALIPAPFPRFLSQLAGVTKAGVDEVISFSVCGILDKPGSGYPLGHPEHATNAYMDYMEWKNGSGRWGLLGATFLGNLNHAAISTNASLLYPPAGEYKKGNLTDGVLGTESMYDKNWLGFEKTDMNAVVDLGAVTSVKKVAVRFLCYRNASIFLPGSVEFSVSNDGKNFKRLPATGINNYSYDAYDCWIDIAAAETNEEARYIKVIAYNTSGRWIFVDEVMVNPEY